MVVDSGQMATNLFIFGDGHVAQPTAHPAAMAIQKLIMRVWLVVLVLAIASGFYIGNGITKPINTLTDAADRISRGEMDLEPLTENRKDEIGRLTTALNRRVTSLKIAMSV